MIKDKRIVCSGYTKECDSVSTCNLMLRSDYLSSYFPNGRKQANVTCNSMKRGKVTWTIYSFEDLMKKVLNDGNM